MNKEQISEIINYLPTANVPDFNVMQAFNRLKGSFMADPNALILISEIAGGNLARKNDFIELISDKAAENPEYANTVKDVIEKLNSAKAEKEVETAVTTAEISKEENVESAPETPEVAENTKTAKKQK